MARANRMTDGAAVKDLTDSRLTMPRDSALAQIVT
jgi:hypothetical protein